MEEIMVKVCYIIYFFWYEVDIPYIFISGCRARLLHANSRRWRWMGSVSSNFSYLSFSSWILTHPPCDRSIKLQAETNFVKCINESKKSLETRHIAPLASRGSDIKGPSASPVPPRPFSPEYNSANEQQSGLDLEGFIQSGNFILKIVGLRKDSNDNSLPTLDLQLKGGVNIIEIIAAIKDAGASLKILLIFSLRVWGGCSRI